MLRPVETGEQDGIVVTMVVPVLIVSVLLLQAVADEVGPLRLVDCFGQADCIMVRHAVDIHGDSPQFG